MTLAAESIYPYVQVGKSGLFVYQVGLGTMQFGWSADEAASFEVLDAYVERGGNFIDTADCYSSWAATMGGPVNAGGVSEAIIGKWFAARKNREDIVLATKVRAAMGNMFCESRATFKQREGLSRRWIIKACEDSLERLQTDYIDLYQAHFIDPLVPIEETLSVFDELVNQGKIRYIGCSNFSAWRLMQALWVSDKRNKERFVSLQPEYNLTSPVRADFESELAAVCGKYDIGVIPYSPLAGGLLTGKYRKGRPLPNSVRAKENSDNRFNDQNFRIIEKVVEIANAYSISPSAVAINWLRSKPWVSAPIVGSNNPAQIIEILDGLDTELASKAIAELDCVSDFRRCRTVLET